MTELPEVKDIHRAEDYTTHEAVKLIVSSGKPIHFVIPIAEERDFKARIRVHLSRCRGAYKKENGGKRMKQFRLKSLTSDYNESNKLIKFWPWSSSANKLTEILSDLNIEL